MVNKNRDFSVGMSTSSDGAGNAMQNLTQSSMNSMEQFITGIRIEKGHPAGASTPGFRPPSVNGINNSGGETGHFGDGAVGPTLHELDPYFPQIFDTDGTQFMENNDYRIVWNDQVEGSADGDPKGDFNLRKMEDETSGSRAAISVVQPTNALRGPLIISGWGYGMDDFPVPQKGSSYPDNTEFDEEMVHDRAKWKTGPVHLMWDDERQVWQGGYHIVCGVVEGEITAPTSVCDPTRFNVKLLRNTQRILEGSGGIPEKLSDIRGEVITVTNRDPSLEQEEQPDSIFCMAIKLNYEWLPLWVGCPSGVSGSIPCIQNS